MSYYQIKTVRVPFGEDTLTAKVDHFPEKYETDSESLDFASDLIAYANVLGDNEFLIVGAVKF